MRYCAALIVCLVVTVPGLSSRADDRPPVMGRNAGVSAGHPLTTAAALETLQKGGNAFDAGVAAHARRRRRRAGSRTVSAARGSCSSIRAAAARSSRLSARAGRRKARPSTGITSRGKTLAGVGLDPAVVPGVLHAALTVLERWGTMSFEQVAARAIDYAEHGFPLRPRTTQAIDANRKFIESWPDNQPDVAQAGRLAYKAGRHDHVADAGAHAEAHGRRRTRAAAGEGAPPASSPRATGSTRATSRARWWRSSSSIRRPSELDDFAEFFAKVEAPAMTTYRGYEVYKHAFGSQGPVLLEALNILEQFDLKSMKRNSADYLHTVVEAMKLAYADRDSYYARSGIRREAGRGAAVEGLSRSERAQIDPAPARRAAISPATRCRSTRR